MAKALKVLGINAPLSRANAGRPYSASSFYDDDLFEDGPFFSPSSFDSKIEKNNLRHSSDHFDDEGFDYAFFDASLPEDPPPFTPLPSPPSDHLVSRASLASSLMKTIPRRRPKTPPRHHQRPEFGHQSCPADIVTEKDSWTSHIERLALSEKSATQRSRTSALVPDRLQDLHDLPSGIRSSNKQHQAPTTPCSEQNPARKTTDATSEVYQNSSYPPRLSSRRLNQTWHGEHTACPTANDSTTPTLSAVRSQTLSQPIEPSRAERRRPSSAILCPFLDYSMEPARRPSRADSDGLSISCESVINDFPATPSNQPLNALSMSFLNPFEELAPRKRDRLSRAWSEKSASSCATVMLEHARVTPDSQNEALVGLQNTCTTERASKQIGEYGPAMSADVAIDGPLLPATTYQMPSQSPRGNDRAADHFPMTFPKVTVHPTAARSYENTPQGSPVPKIANVAIPDRHVSVDTTRSPVEKEILPLLRETGQQQLGSKVLTRVDNDLFLQVTYAEAQMILSVRKRRLAMQQSHFEADHVNTLEQELMQLQVF